MPHFAQTNLGPMATRCKNLEGNPTSSRGDEYLLPKPATAAAHHLETQKTVRPARGYKREECSYKNLLYHAKLCTDTFETHGNAVQKSATQSNIISWRYEYLLPKPATAAAHHLETQKTVRPARGYKREECSSKNVLYRDLKVGKCLFT